METNPKLTALKLFLNTLDVSDEISTVDDRKRVQKAVYLGQAAGADLGYRFGWYLMGPYCADLTDDYYALDAKREEISQVITRTVLHPQYQTRLNSIKSTLCKPEAVGLAAEEWFELLASYHYLRHVNKLSDPAAKSILQEKKRRLVPWLSEAKKALNANTYLRV